jgi:hypothetical protein
MEGGYIVTHVYESLDDERPHELGAANDHDAH